MGISSSLALQTEWQKHLWLEAKTRQLLQNVWPVVSRFVRLFRQLWAVCDGLLLPVHCVREDGRESGGKLLHMWLLYPHAHRQHNLLDEDPGRRQGAEEHR